MPVVYLSVTSVVGNGYITTTSRTNGDDGVCAEADGETLRLVDLATCGKRADITSRIRTLY